MAVNMRNLSHLLACVQETLYDVGSGLGGSTGEIYLLSPEPQFEGANQSKLLVELVKKIPHTPHGEVGAMPALQEQLIIHRTRPLQANLFMPLYEDEREHLPYVEVCRWVPLVLGPEPLGH
jgi:hypothetical protein